MKELTTVDEFNEAIQQPALTVVEFFTEWCPDCHRIDPFMPEVEEDYRDKLTFVKVNRDSFEELASQYDVIGIPSFIAFRNGNEVVRFVSKLGKKREEIEQFLDRAVAVSSALSE